MKYLFILIAFIGCISISHSQDLQFLFDNQIKQHKWTDPSYVKKDTGLTIVLPGLDFRYHNSGPSLSDILIDQGAGVYELSLEGQLDKFDDQEYFGGELSIPALGIDWRIGDQMFSVGYQLNAQSILKYEKDLVELYHLGNEPFIGETMQLGPDFLINAYQEIYLGYAKQIGSFNIGARFKFVTGIEDLSTSSSRIELYTDPDIYQLTTTTDYVVNGSGALTYNSLDDFSLDFDGFKLDKFGNNKGWGLDLAFSGKVGDKLTYGFSAVDIGKINWDFEVDNITSKNIQSFNGINIVDLLDDDNDIVLEDSIKQLLAFEESRVNYSNDLFAKYHVRLTYDVSHNYTIGGLIAIHSGKENNSVGYAINNNYKIGGALGLNAQLGVYDLNPYLGLGLRWSAGPFQLYAALDNVISSVTKGNYNSGRFTWSLSF